MGPLPSHLVIFLIIYNIICWFLKTKSSYLIFFSSFNCQISICVCSLFSLIKQFFLVMASSIGSSAFLLETNGQAFVLLDSRRISKRRKHSLRFPPKLHVNALASDNFGSEGVVEKSKKVLALQTNLLQQVLLSLLFYYIL